MTLVVVVNILMIDPAPLNAKSRLATRPNMACKQAFSSKCLVALDKSANANVVDMRA